MNFNNFTLKKLEIDVRSHMVKINGVDCSELIQELNITFCTNETLFLDIKTCFDMRNGSAKNTCSNFSLKSY